MTNPARDCPRFNRCAVNRCPLDPAYAELRGHEDDAEQRCGQAKVRRLEIASKYPGVLPYEGLTGNEYTGRERTESFVEASETLIPENVALPQSNEAEVDAKHHSATERKKSA